MCAPFAENRRKDDLLGRGILTAGESARNDGAAPICANKKDCCRGGFLLQQFGDIGEISKDSCHRGGRGKYTVARTYAGTMLRNETGAAVPWLPRDICVQPRVETPKNQHWRSPRQWEKGNAVAMDLMQPGLDKYWNL